MEGEGRISTTRRKGKEQLGAADERFNHNRERGGEKDGPAQLRHYNNLREGKFSWKKRSSSKENNRLEVEEERKIPGSAARKGCLERGKWSPIERGSKAAEWRKEMRGKHLRKKSEPR